MSFFLDWYSDGWYALLGLVALGLLLLVIACNVGRKCKPLRGMLFWAVVWHMVVFAYYILWVVPYYGNVADARGYHEEGIEIARMVHAGEWATIKWGLSTTATNLLTGFLYTFFGADAFGISFVSAVMGLTASIYFCRSFDLFASPELTRKYCYIIMFMPSLVLWAGLFGKDSWVALGLGFAAYGYSSMQKSGRSRGIWYLGAGLLLAGIIRPHIALAISISMAFAYVWGLTQNTRGSAPMKLLRVTVLVAVVVALYPITVRFVGLGGDVTADNMQEYMRTNGEMNARAGGSVVEIQAAPGVLGAIRALPRGIVRVLLQPFPWEVRNLNSALAALENLFVAWFLFRYARHVRGLLRELSREPYLLFSGFLSFALLAMFTFVPNLGLISRQRIQLMPFLFAVLISGERRRKRPPLTHDVLMIPREAATATPRRAQVR